MNLDQLKTYYAGKKVLLTGHTGFKGAWMLQLLHGLGAEVKGFSLAPAAHDLYTLIGGDRLCYASVQGDIRDLRQLQGELVRFRPDYVFHLAAQSLVRRSYEDPVESFAVNAMGTAHVLESMRRLEDPCVGVVITTDKVYENPERGEAFREDDKLGGHDPYSASKAAAEIITSSYCRSFFGERSEGARKSVAAARAGNVIGGGDYADNRIIPDLVRALDAGVKPVLRNPLSVRPWQHVLESLSAYLVLGAAMSRSKSHDGHAYNFGPDAGDVKTVEELTHIFLDAYGRKGFYEIVQDAQAPHEAKLLLLDSAKAAAQLSWKPRLDAETAIRWTAAWYADKQRDAGEKCRAQIGEYFRL